MFMYIRNCLKRRIVVKLGYTLKVFIFSSVRNFMLSQPLILPLVIQCVPLATEPGWLAGWLAGGPLLRVASIRRTTDTFLFISHTTNVLLFKFRCSIFIGVRIIKEMPGSVASGTLCIHESVKRDFLFRWKILSYMCLKTK